jgi:hypothetical protein
VLVLLPVGAELDVGDALAIAGAIAGEQIEIVGGGRRLRWHGE